MAWWGEEGKDDPKDVVRDIWAKWRGELRWWKGRRRVMVPKKLRRYWTVDFHVYESDIA